MNSDTVEGRLLCACNVAYDIHESGPVRGRSWYVLGADFVEPAIARVGGKDQIDAALVCRSTDGVVLAFRGTLPGPTPESPRRILEDWLQNLDTCMVPFDGVGGAVHEGFLRGLESIWREVYFLVTAGLRSMQTPRLLVTGHSKGGAMAHLAAARFSKSGVIASRDISVHAFGTPRLGDTEFVSAYRALVPVAYRFECQDEIAPYLPPSDDVYRLLKQVMLITDPSPPKNYELVGELRFIDWDDKVVADSGDLENERVRRLDILLRRHHFDKIRADHNIECLSTYMKAIWPSRVCLG